VWGSDSVVNMELILNGSGYGGQVVARAWDYGPFNAGIQLPAPPDGGAEDPVAGSCGSGYLFTPGAASGDAGACILPPGATHVMCDSDGVCVPEGDGGSGIPPGVNGCGVAPLTGECKLGITQYVKAPDCGRYVPSNWLDLPGDVGALSGLVMCGIGGAAVQGMNSLIWVVNVVVDLLEPGPSLQNQIVDFQEMWRTNPVIAAYNEGSAEMADVSLADWESSGGSDTTIHLTVAGRDVAVDVGSAVRQAMAWIEPYRGTLASIWWFAVAIYLLNILPAVMMIESSFIGDNWVFE
jgi:hypothetical protein